MAYQLVPSTAKAININVFCATERAADSTSERGKRNRAIGHRERALVDSSEFTEFTESKLISRVKLLTEMGQRVTSSPRRILPSANRDLFRPRRPRSATFGNYRDRSRRHDALIGAHTLSTSIIRHWHVALRYIVDERAMRTHYECIANV